MTTQVTVTLSQRLSEQIQRLAQLHQQDVAEIVETVLSDALERSGKKQAIDPAAPNVPALSPQKVALKREKAAYIKLHPRLKDQYFGQHVAIYNGELIDVDQDFGTLYERVRSRLPNQVVWITKVQAEPIGTIMMRSPRFVTPQNR